MSTVVELLVEIEQFCREAEIAEATFGSRAVRDGKFVDRLRSGGGVTLRTAERVRAYIADERKLMAERRAPKATEAAPSAETFSETKAA